MQVEVAGHTSGPKWLAIVNPVSGDGITGRDWPFVDMLLREAGICFEPVFTRYKYHAVELTVKAVNEGCRHIIVVGGDRTLYEVVNGLYIQQAVSPLEVLLGIIPSPHDRGEGFAGVPEEYPDAVAAIASGCFSLRPLAVVSYEEAGYRQERYMAVNGYVGLDACMARRIGLLREEGTRNYVSRRLAGARLLASCRAIATNICIDGRELNNISLSGARIGLCRRQRNGEWMLELSVLYRVSRSWILRVLFSRWGEVFVQRMYRRGLTECRYGRNITISASQQLEVGADGDSIGYAPVTFRLIDDALKVVVR